MSSRPQQPRKRYQKYSDLSETLPGSALHFAIPPSVEPERRNMKATKPRSHTRVSDYDLSDDEGDNTPGCSSTSSRPSQAPDAFGPPPAANRKAFFAERFQPQEQEQWKMLCLPTVTDSGHRGRSPPSKYKAESRSTTVAKPQSPDPAEEKQHLDAAGEPETLESQTLIREEGPKESEAQKNKDQKRDPIEVAMLVVLFVVMALCLVCLSAMAGAIALLPITKLLNTFGEMSSVSVMSLTAFAMFAMHKMTNLVQLM